MKYKRVHIAVSAGVFLVFCSRNYCALDVDWQTRGAFFVQAASLVCLIRTAISSGSPIASISTNLLKTKMNFR
ncbi:MAG: hypothetical protein ACR2MG_13230 [Pyrinomonadaceae bacterium]